MNESVEWLKSCIRGVLDSLNWKYLSEEDVGAREVVCIFGAGDQLGNWVLINRVIPSKRVLLSMATCQENVPDGAARSQAIDFVARANFGILNGFFDMDMSDGDLRFTSRIEYGFMQRNEFEANFRRTFQIVHGTFSKYLPGIVGVTRRGMSGRAAVELVEGGANTVPDASSTPLLAAVALHLKAASTNFVCHPQKSLIRLPCTVQGVTFHLRIKAMENTKHVYVFCNYPRNAGKVPTDRAPAMIEYICRANWALPFGYFDMDLTDGELRFVTWLPARGIDANVVQTQFIRALVVSAITTFVKYLPGIDEVVKGALSPELAIAKVEGGAVSPVDVPSVSDILESVMSSSDDDEDAQDDARDASDAAAADDDDDDGGGGGGEDLGEEVNYFPVDLSAKQYGNDADVFEFIGSRGQSTAWRNPCEAGFVHITSSGLLDDSDALSSLVGRLPARCVTKGSQDAWIAVDLLRCRLRPTSYRLRHYSSSDTEALRWWKFEGSTDANTWETLSEHRNDASVTSRASAPSWRVHARRHFRHFRLMITGPNSNHRFHLACGHLEIFGHLLADFAVEPHLVSSAPDDVAADAADADVDDDLKLAAAARSGESVLISSDELELDERDATSLMGTGPHGAVWRANYAGIDVVAKIIDTSSWTRAECTALRAAIVRLASVAHKHLLQVIGVIDETDANADKRSRFVIVEQRCTNGDLSALRRRHRQLSFAARVQIALALAKAVKCLHAHDVVHGALKPANVLFDNQQRVKLADAGLAAVCRSRHAAADISMAFCAPELLLGGDIGGGGAAADVYALGMLVFEVITGDQAFNEASHVPPAALCARIVHERLRPTLPATLPGDVATLLRHMWNAEAAARPNAKHVVSVLNTAAAASASAAGDAPSA